MHTSLITAPLRQLSIYKSKTRSKQKRARIAWLETWNRPLKMRAARLFIVWWKKKKKKGSIEDSTTEKWWKLAGQHGVEGNNFFIKIRRHNSRAGPAQQLLHPPPSPFKTRNGGHFHVPSSACTSRLSIGKIGYCENPRWLYVRVRSTFESMQEEDIYIYIFIGIFLWGLVSIDLWFWNSFELKIIVFLIGKRKKGRLKNIFNKKKKA